MATDDHPLVSFVIPVLNEAGHLEQAVASVLDQDYPGPREVVLALGPSTDGTTAIAHRLREQDDRIRLVDNPGADIPLGLNLAIAASSGAVVARVDAHAELPPDYIDRMVAVLDRTGAVNVGGVMLARGVGPLQSAVARAYNSPLGLGGGVYHGGDQEGPAESAYLGVFRRWVLEEVGGYDPSLRRAEDYDLNQRIIGAGHRVWFVPDVEVAYWPRRSWGALTRQMWATGTWRGELMRRTRRTGLRYLAPPLLVLGTSAAAVTAAAEVLGEPPTWLAVSYLAPAAYGAFLAVAAARLGGRGASDRAMNATVLATMHLSWGAGLLKGLVTGARDTVDRSRITVPARSAGG